MMMSNLVPVPSVLADQPLLGRGIGRDETFVHVRLKTHRMNLYIFASKTHGMNPKSNVCDSRPKCPESSFTVLITFLAGRA